MRFQPDHIDKLFEDALDVTVDAPMIRQSQSSIEAARMGNTRYGSQPDNVTEISRLTGEAIAPVETRFFDTTLELIDASTKNGPEQRVSSELFFVRVTKTSGSAGNQTSPCTFVYTVRDMAGYVLLQGASPAKFRMPIGAYIAPPDGSLGIAGRIEDGSIRLFDANEVPDPGPC